MNLWHKYKGLATLALLFAIAPAIVWQYAVDGTVAQWRQASRQSRQIEELRASQTSAAKASHTTLSDAEMIASGLLVAELLPAIEEEKLRIEHFSPCVTSEADGGRLTTGQLSVRGGFRGMVKLLDKLERELPQCKVISTLYRSNRPRNRNEAKTLTCTIYVQQITTTDR